MQFRLHPVLSRFATWHLALAGILVPRKKQAGSVLDYSWNRSARGCSLAPKQRPKWLEADAGLELFSHKDSAKGRRQFVERLDSRMEAGKNVRKSDILTFIACPLLTAVNRRPIKALEWLTKHLTRTTGKIHKIMR